MRRKPKTIPTGKKFCSSCRKTKDLFEFGTNAGKPACYCKTCNRIRQANYRASEAGREKAREYNQRPEVKRKKLDYFHRIVKTPKRLEWRKAYDTSPKNILRRRIRAARKRLEKIGSAEESQKILRLIALLEEQIARLDPPEEDDEPEAKPKRSVRSAERGESPSPPR